MIARPAPTMDIVRSHDKSRTRFETRPTKMPAEISKNHLVR